MCSWWSDEHDRNQRRHRRPAGPARPGPLAQKNLFSTWFNTLLTIVTASIVAVVVYGLIRWIFFQANWSPVVENLRLYAVGPYPQEQMWRIWTIVYMVSFLKVLVPANGVARC